MVGEYALVLGEDEQNGDDQMAVRAASVRAIMPTTLVKIPRHQFNQRLDELHPMMKRLVRILVGREVALSRRLFQTSMEAAETLETEGTVSEPEMPQPDGTGSSRGGSA